MICICLILGTISIMVCMDCAMMSPLESQATTDAEMRLDVELCHQYAPTVN